MNVYFLVEGRRTEPYIYPAYLNHAIPGLEKVDSYDEVSSNSYYLFSSGGYPTILDDVNNAIEDINSCGLYDLLVVCLDSDGDTKEQVTKNVFDSIKTPLKNCEIIVLVQEICFETWFLGNRKIVKRQPSSDFKPYLDFYDVRISDPVAMDKTDAFELSRSQFHAHYLKKMLLERRVSYSKSKPKHVASRAYYDELNKRINDTDHLESFGDFIRLCDKISSQLK